MLHLIYHWVIIFRSLLRSRDSSLTILDVKKQSQFEKTVLLAPIWTGAALPLSRCRACGRSGSAVFLLISTASTVALKSQSLLQQSLSTEKGKWTKTSRCNPRIHTQAHTQLSAPITESKWAIKTWELLPRRIPSSPPASCLTVHTTVLDSHVPGNSTSANLCNKH